MTGGPIYLNPPELEDAAKAARKLADALEQAEKAIRGVSLAGLPPAAERRTHAAIVTASAQSRQASHDARGQVGKLEARSKMARRADTWGGTFKNAWGDFWSLPSGWDQLGFLDSARTTLLGDIRGRIEKEEHARKKFKNAKKLWESEAWRRKEWSSPRKMFKELKRTPINRIRYRERYARFLDPKSLVPHGVKTSPLVQSVATSGAVNNPAIRRVTSKVPVIGAGITYIGNKNDGNNRSDADAAAKTAVQTAGSAIFGGIGASVCAGATAATLGLGAATCPVLILSGSFAGDKLAGALYDPGKKAVGALASGGKKVWKWTGL